MNHHAQSRSPYVTTVHAVYCPSSHIDKQTDLLNSKSSHPDDMNRYPTHTRLLHKGLKNFLRKPNLTHPEKTFTAQQYNAKVRANMSTTANSGMPNSSSAPGEQFEPRQTATSEDYTPDASKSIPLSGPRQRLVDDVSSAD
jgi:hypothetical protein